MAPPTPLAPLGDEIQDPDEGIHPLLLPTSPPHQPHPTRNLNLSPESFLLFSQPLPSRDLGMVDSKATMLDVTIAGRDLTIEQSPSILASSREGGTTGAGKFLPHPSAKKAFLQGSCFLEARKF